MCARRARLFLGFGWLEAVVVSTGVVLWLGLCSACRVTRSTIKRLAVDRVQRNSRGFVDEAAATDELIIEEPLTIQLDGVAVTTTMRTPSDDFELAAGFCFTEGLVEPRDVVQVRYCGGESAAAASFDVVMVDTGGFAPTPQARLGMTSSSCGLCGSEVLHELMERIGPLPEHEPWDPELLMLLPGRVVDHQPLRDATGSVHIAAAFDRDGSLVVAREDIGRHNAVDKVIGRLLLDGALPAEDRLLFVSSRASFEMVHKAWAGGFTALAAASGPSALAVAAAQRAGMTLAGFVRPDRVNRYSTSQSSRPV